jgi:prepilin-type N-terminal cleavage/methylation domain-containing protein
MRKGFTLIEMVCVIILLAVLAGVMAVFLRETLEIERLQAEGFDKILQNNALADQFRADVAQAVGAPPEWQRYQAGPATLILRMPSGGHVVYLPDEESLERRAVENGQLSLRRLPIGGQHVKVEFDRAIADSKLIRLRVYTLHKGSPLSGQALEIAAALGGDWR